MLVKFSFFLLIVFSVQLSGQEPDFTLTINVAGGGTNYVLKFGFSQEATDDYDGGYCSDPQWGNKVLCENAGEIWTSAIDQYAPPPPPAPNFDAALSWDGERYYTQILASSTEERIWDIQLQYPENNLITLSWDNVCWSLLGSFVLQDVLEGTVINVDMTVENSLTLDNSAYNVLKLKVTANSNSELAVPQGFEFTPTPASGVFQGQVTIAEEPAAAGDWIAAFDAPFGYGNCAGSAELVIHADTAYINLQIYGDDYTTSDVDEGMNTGEDFYLVLWDSSECVYYEYPGGFGNWSNNNGAPMPGYDDPNVVYDFMLIGPTADFNADINEGFAPLEVHFSDASSDGTGVISSYSWDFGDGDSNIERNPVHTYNSSGEYSVSLTVTDENGFSATEIKTNYILVTNIVTAKLNLPYNYPNPVRSSTFIFYELLQSSRVTIIIYDLIGQQVRSLISREENQPGKKSIYWDGNNYLGDQVSSGIYFYRIKTDIETEIGKMVVIR